MMRFKKQPSTRTGPSRYAVQPRWLTLGIEHMLRSYYLAWWRERIALEAACERWLKAADGRAFAHASYLIALDREEHAAGQYARVI
jgi:hypothetical protein